MKKILFLTAIFLGVLSANAQETKPTFQKKGDLVKGTFYYQDGTIRQQGTYKNGKLNGKWVMYNKNGGKIALANYKNGKKNGQWFFWQGKKLTEVNYKKNKIADVTEWKNRSTLAINP